MKQEVNENGDLIFQEEVAFDLPVNDDEEDQVEDSYLQSQFDFMYSEDSKQNQEEEEPVPDIRTSIHLREKEFYGDDSEGE